MNTSPAKLATPEVPPIAVDEYAAAVALGVSVPFLRKDRRTRQLFPFYRVGTLVRYNLQRLAEALATLEEGGAPIRGRRSRSAQ